MNVIEAIDALKQGKKLRRTDWGWAKAAYLIVLDHFHTDQLYMVGQYNDDPSLTAGYGMTWPDIQSVNWEVVNH